MTKQRAKPFSKETSAALIELVGAMLEMQGFRLMPVRAPSIVNGSPRMRCAWKKTDADETQTVRITISRPRPIE
jgi:hypothetical protein